MHYQLKRIRWALVALLALAFAAAAQDYHGGAVDPHQHGFEHGYRDGFGQGRVDRHDNHSYEFRTEDFRLADRGYEPYMGSHQDFVDGYRDGYKAGYDDAFRGREGRWDSTYRITPGYDPYQRAPEDRADSFYESRRWGYQDVAYDIGYRDGLAAGEHDGRKKKEFRPEKNDAYEDGDHGYNKSYGDKAAYKTRYRSAFVRGYQDGFGRWR